MLIIGDQRANAQTDLSQLLSSSTGHKLTAEALAVGMAGVAVGWAALRRSRSSLVIVGLGASAVMLARALAGHADASSVPWFTVGVQWAHLVSVGAWAGGLAWLLLAMHRGDPGQGDGLARRFSTLAGAALAVVAVSGTARAVNLVGAWGRLVHTDFGVTLLVKVGLFGALVGLGALSRFRRLPTARERRSGLRRVVRGEVAMAAGVLGATAVLAGLPPPASLAAAVRPAHVQAVIVSGNDDATSVRVRLVVTPGLPGPNYFDAAVSDSSNQPVAAQAVSLTFQNNDQPDLAAASLELARGPEGHWTAFGRQISIEGRWTVMALVETSTDVVHVRMELVPRKPATTATPAPGQSDAGSACGLGQPDPAYTVDFDADPNPPRLEGATLHLTVRRNGRTITGAKVCLAADMPDMQHPGITKVAKEISGGRYDAELKFGMGGAWAMAVTVAEPGQPVVYVRLKVEVS